MSSGCLSGIGTVSSVLCSYRASETPQALSPTCAECAEVGPCAAVFARPRRTALDVAAGHDNCMFLYPAAPTTCYAKRSSYTLGRRSSTTEAPLFTTGAIH